MNMSEEAYYSLRIFIWLVIWTILILLTIYAASAYPHYVRDTPRSGAYLIVGEQHLTSMQKSYMHAALNKPCNGRIIVITPYPSGTGIIGQANGIRITVWAIHQHTPIELYCLMRHECRELQRGEQHNWEFVWRECKDEIWRYK